MEQELLAPRNPQPTSAPHHLLSFPQPINYKSAVVSPDAIISIVVWAVFGWRGNLAEFLLKVFVYFQIGEN